MASVAEVSWLKNVSGLIDETTVFLKHRVYLSEYVQ
jgi:hypothetical protein